MKKRVIDCISAPNDADRLDRVVGSFALETIEDSGLPQVDLERLMMDAEACLNEDISHVLNVEYQTNYAISTLGKTRQRKGDSNAEQAVRRSARQMAQILCAYKEDITLSVISQSDGMGQVNTQFLISSEAASHEPLSSMIRSVYGKVGMSPVKDIPDFPLQLHAAGTVQPSLKNEEKRDKSKIFDSCESWITAVLTAVPSSGNYTVRLHFSPIQDTSKIKKKIKSLGDFYRKLRFHGEVNWSNIVNIGLSVNEGQTVVHNMVGTDVNSYNSGYSMNLGSMNIQRRATQLAERIECEIQRLTQAIHTSCWAVGISISATDMETAQTLISVLSGTLAAAKIWLTWSENPSITPLVVNAEEVLPMMYFPTREFCGFRFSENEEFSLVSQCNDHQGFEIGNILWNGTPFSSFCLSPNALSRHAFICGMTGSGKTNTLFRIMEGFNIPFLVIEPVKGEYRALKALYPDLQMWTMRVEDSQNTAVKMMRINPFWFPEGGSLAFHIDSLRTIISASFELTAAMPNILEQCLYNIYVKSGWDLVTNRNIYWGKVSAEYLYPTFTDLCNEVEYYLNHSDFSQETMGDYKGALLSRLKSFVFGYKGILLNTTAYPDYAQIMGGHSVLEMDGLADDADKCLVMGTVLIQYYQYLKLHFKDSPMERKLQHLLVIEEAHRLFKNIKVGKGENGGPNPTGQLVDSLSNMMAEIRAFGEGMLIVDQSPTKVAEDVIKNSATKIVHRIDNANDIKAIQSAMLLPDDLLSFAALSQGEALIRADGMEKPCKVKIHRSTVKDAYSLADSFQSNFAASTSLADLFIAASVLGNEQTSELVQEKIQVFLNCLVFCGMDLWNNLVGEMLVEILDVLKDQKAEDAVDYRMGVLFEIISISLKKMYSGENKRNLGCVHMMVMRLLGLYREYREGLFVKPRALEILQRYLDANVTGVVKVAELERVGKDMHQELCRAAKLEPDAMISLMISGFVQSILPAIEYRQAVPATDALISSFLANCVSFSAQVRIVEQYYSTFEHLKAYLEKNILEEHAYG